jgi:lipopolysaccharide/colanic/teichoic acid biosynthesis glycosyltransferase
MNATVTNTASARRRIAIRGRTQQPCARGRFYFSCKRCMDVVLATTSLVLLSPLFVLIAILVKLDTPGPALFKQKRVGICQRWINGRSESEICFFTFYKYRTMHHNAGDRCHREFMRAFISNDRAQMSELQNSDTNAHNQYKMVGDSRVTPLGRILRKTSLDELPQLWNVLKGEMSLVGPRPPIPYEVEMYEPWHRLRLEAKPGITGLWQVVARSSTVFDEMVELDIEYVLHRSLWLDIKILLVTPFVVVSGQGAE